VVDYTVEEWERMMHVNTTSCFLAIKYAAPAMQTTNTEKGKEDAGGSIIMTASGARYVFFKSPPLCCYGTLGSRVRVGSLFGSDSGIGTSIDQS
jgi:NAD(P)-dependent dehydrogenase (short-subunit alcohol dehydrogenase family)